MPIFTICRQITRGCKGVISALITVFGGIVMLFVLASGLYLGYRLVTTGALDLIVRILPLAWHDPHTLTASLALAAATDRDDPAGATPANQTTRQHHED